MLLVELINKLLRLRIFRNKIWLLFILFYLVLGLLMVSAQVKFVVEDFEGFADGTSDLKPNGIFTFGSIKAAVSSENEDGADYAGRRNIKLHRSGTENYGGWGKGIGLFAELNVGEDFLNFYCASNDTGSIRIEIQEDDDDSGVFEKESDDLWTCSVKPWKKAGSGWTLVSVPLSAFKDDNPGGDGTFNISYKKGRLFAIVFSFAHSKNDQTWAFDFICFSRGKLQQGKDLFSAPAPDPGAFCSLGAWSKEGNSAQFSSIPASFEGSVGSGKKLAVAHFFHPFAFDGGMYQNFYPSVERVNQVIDDGYLPMITLEDHFVNIAPNQKQPNLYSIVEGHFDPFFSGWAREIKKVKGLVLLRILHEFNGDWYPWCLANNDHNPELLVNAFRHIRNIFYKEDARNVKFIWCPNSMSVPQAGWNCIMDAYPGNEWVDFVGLDIYNGAGKGFQPWRSFRKEGSVNYFILTQYLPDKPILICETASRERDNGEAGQTKAEWIAQMSRALQTDMSKVRLLCWFNEKKTFRVNSSEPARVSFLAHIMNEPYFLPGRQKFISIVRY